MRANERRALRAGCALVAVVATAIVGPAPSASAANTWSFVDDMEVHGSSDPAGRFSFQSDGWRRPGHIGDDPPTDMFPIQAHSGTHFADVSAGFGTDWSSAGQMVTIEPVARGLPSSCSFDAWTYAGYVDFNIEVIDPATYRYLAVATVRHGIDWQYQKMSTPSFTPNISTVLLRVSLIGSNVRYAIGSHIDDFALTCTF